MIGGIELVAGSGYTLTCDYCGEECEEAFDTWDDAVAYRKDKANGWRTIKDKHNEFCDLCPACNKPELIAKLRGWDEPKQDEKTISRLAGIATEDFKGFNEERRCQMIDCKNWGFPDTHCSTCRFYTKDSSVRATQDYIRSFITPEQYKARTGKEYPQKESVMYKSINSAVMPWQTCAYEKALEQTKNNKTGGWAICCVLGEKI